jgi:hypothetical protein
MPAFSYGALGWSARYVGDKGVSGLIFVLFFWGGGGGL